MYLLYFKWAKLKEIFRIEFNFVFVLCLCNIILLDIKIEEKEKENITTTDKIKILWKKIFSKYNYSKGSFFQCNGFYLIFPFLYLLDEIFLYGKTLAYTWKHYLCHQWIFYVLKFCSNNYINKNKIKLPNQKVMQ